MPIIISGLNREQLLVNASWDATAFNQPANHSSLSSASIKKSPDLLKLFQRKRCIIPMNGYYDWKKITESIHIPFYFRILNQDVFGVAGIFEILEDESYVFLPIETRANEIVEPLSETMPAILSKELIDKWLDPLFPNSDKLHDFLMPHKTIEMSSYRVTLQDTDTKSNSKELIQPVV
jgi:putative SOS response-associated peptidase YedK